MKNTRGRGRPRQFDPDQVLERAMQVFWRQGYEGTSVADLTRATGIAAPSLYATFGNKAALFHQAVERYFEGPLSYLTTAVEQPTARAVAEHVLRNGARLFTSAKNPAGCLFVTGVLSSSSLDQTVRRALLRKRRSRVGQLERRFRKAIDSGDLGPGTDAAALARYLMGLHFGLAVHAAAGAGRAELMRVVQLALERWPTPSSLP